MSIGSLFVSSKVEELQPPTLRDFIVAASPRRFTESEILEAELEILKVVEFKIID